MIFSLLILTFGWSSTGTNTLTLSRIAFPLCTSISPDEDKDDDGDDVEVNRDGIPVPFVPLGRDEEKPLMIDEIDPFLSFEPEDSCSDDEVVGEVELMIGSLI